MVDDNFSCIKEVTKTVHVALPTACTSNEISGISDVLESWKRQYIQQLKAIVVGYRDVSLTSVRGYIKLDSPVVHYDVTATFELFYPTVGSILKGKINRVCHDYIGCLVHNTINVTIDNRPKDLPTDVANLIVLDRLILFEITRLDYKFKIIRVIGKITQKCVDLMKESDMFNFQNEESNYTSAYSSDINATNQTRHILYSDEESTSFVSDKAASDTNQYSSPVVSSSETVPLNKTKKKNKKKHASSELNYASAYSSEDATNQTKPVVDSDEETNSDISDKAASDANEYSSPVVSSSSEAIPLNETEKPKKKHKAKKNSVSNDKVLSDYRSLLAISDIKKEPIDKTKKGKKRTREESGDSGSPTKKKKKSDSSKIKDKVHGKKKREDKSKKDSNDAYSSENAMNQTKQVAYSAEENNSLISDETANDINQYLSTVISSSETVPLNKTKKEPSDYQSLATIGDIKNESIDKAKKSKKRTRDESGDAGSPSKKKRKSDGDSSKIKDKVHGKKKRKDKSKKDSKRDKKSKDKVISTKKKLHGYKNNMKKKKKDKKEKSLAKKDDKSKTKKDRSKSKKDKTKTKEDKLKTKKLKTEN